MARNRLCGNCGERYPISAERCPSCGTHAPRATREDSPVQEVHPRRCEHMTRDGMRCCWPGSISPSTQGGGPYYCRSHYPYRERAFADWCAKQSQGYSFPNAYPMPGELAREYGLENAAIVGASQTVKRERPGALAAVMSTLMARKPAVAVAERVPGEDDE